MQASLWNDILNNRTFQIFFHISCNSEQLNPALSHHNSHFYKCHYYLNLCVSSMSNVSLLKIIFNSFNHVFRFSRSSLSSTIFWRSTIFLKKLSTVFRFLFYVFAVIFRFCWIFLEKLEPWRPSLSEGWHNNEKSWTVIFDIYVQLIP